MVLALASNFGIVEYTGNDVATSVNYPHAFFEKSDILVQKVVIATGVVSTLVLDTDYTISTSGPFPSGADINNAGAVAIPSTERWILSRQASKAQNTEYPQSGVFPSASHEASLDRLYSLIQSVEGKLLRTPQINLAAPLSTLTDVQLPAPVDDYSLAWDGVTGKLKNIALSVDTLEAATAAAAASAAAALVSENNAAASLALTNADVVTTNANVVTTNADAASSTASAAAAAASAAAAVISASETSAIAGGSLNTYTLLPSGTWNPTLSGDAKQITGTTTINLPPPAANFRIHYHVIGNQSVTVNRDDTEDIIIGTQTFSDDVRSSEWGFYTITCLGGADYTITRSNTTDIYAEAPTGADGVGIPAGGLTNQVLGKVDGTDYNTEWKTVSGTGDVVGPASSTDNAIARFDSTTGKVIQNSGATIDDSGNIATSGTVDGRDVSADGTKLDGIEAAADVTDATNVNAAGAVMESDFTPAHSLIVQQAGTGSPEMLTVSNNTLVGKQTGDIADLSISTVRTMLEVLDPPIIVACSDETTAITTGTGKVTFRMPYAFTLTEVRASCTTAPTGSTIIIDINEGGSSILSTKLSIDATEKTSTTAASAAVISDSALADDAEITIDFDQVGSTIAGAGVKVTLIGTKG